MSKGNQNEREQSADKMYNISEISNANFFAQISNANGLSNQKNSAIPYFPPRVDFFGRTAELERIQIALSTTSNQNVILVDALGGMGKTAFAIEAAYRAKNAGMFKAYVFVTAKQTMLAPTGIVESDLDALAADDFINETVRALGRKDIVELEKRDKKKAFFTLLQEVPTLLVFDNLETLGEEQAAIERFLAKIPEGSKAILTSRYKGVGVGWHFPLEKLEWHAAQKIIEKQRDLDRDLAKKLNVDLNLWKELYTETFGSPLALMHILGLMRLRVTLDISSAIAMLKTKEEDIMVRIDFMFDEARKELDSNDNVILHALSYFVPSADILALSAVTQLQKKELLSAINHLDKLNLLDTVPNANRYTLHPLTREFIKNKLQNNLDFVSDIGMRYVRYWYEYVEKFGGNQNHKTFPFIENEWSNINAATDRLWEITDLVNVTIEQKYIGKIFMQFARALSKFLAFSGRWDEQILICERCYQSTLAHGDDFNAGWSAYFVALTWNKRGNIQDAKTWTKKAIDSWRIGGGRSEEAEGLRLLGILAMSEKDFKLAEESFKNSLSIYEDLNEIQSIAIISNSLGNLAMVHKQYDTAEQYYLRALNITDNNSNKAIYSYGLGNLEFYYKNDIIAARKWFELTLQIAEEFGQREIIAQSYMGLARLDEIEGNTSSAISLAENAFTIFEQLQHRNTQTSMDFLAKLKPRT